MANYGRKENTGNGERQLWTGFGKCTVKLVNPTKEELAAAIGYELKSDAKDLVYEGKTQKGDDFVSVHFWMQADTPEKQWFNAKFMLIDKDVISEKSGKQQYVSQIGASNYIDNVANLPEWFSHFQKEEPAKSKQYVNVADKQVRKAIMGEANLYHFMTTWLNKINLYDTTTNVLIDIKKAFRNIDKYIADEFLPHIKLQEKWDTADITERKRLEKEEMWSEPVIALATVYTGEKDGEVVHYQQVYNDFLPGWLFGKLTLSIGDGNWKGTKSLEKYHTQLTSEFGPKDAFTISLLQPFDPNNHIQASQSTFKSEDGSTEPVTDTTY